MTINKLILVATAAFGAFFAIVLLFMPAELLQLYGVRLDPSSIYVPRYLGAAFLGLAALDWFASAEEGELSRAIVRGNLAHASVGLLISAFDLLNRGNTMVWSIVGIYLLMTAGFVYLELQARLPTAGVGMGRMIPH